MASATSDDFLSGQGVPVDLKDVETELTRLWGPAAEQAGGPDLENPHVTRVALSNLVVVGHVSDSDRLVGVIDEVAAEHPSRTIVVRRTDDPGRSVTAEVSALCHLPAPGMPQVCSERIVLRAGPDASDLVPGAVRPLLEAELPFILWWTRDPREDEALFRDLGRECSRLILDLPDPRTDPAAIKLGLDPSICRESRDTAWFGLARWRELVAQFFDPSCHTGILSRIDLVKIDAVAPSADYPARTAVWLAAWLAGQLGWGPVGKAVRDGGSLSAKFRGPSGEISVSIRTQADPSRRDAHVRGIALTTRGSAGNAAELFRLARASGDSPEVRVEIDSNAFCSLPRTVISPELDAAHRVSVALESRRNAPPFPKALPHALWMLGV